MRWKSPIRVPLRPPARARRRACQHIHYRPSLRLGPAPFRGATRVGLLPLPLRILAVALAVLAGSGWAAGAPAQELSLEEATRLALARDPMADSFAARARSQEHESVAEAQLPDPRFRVGALNVPTDSFSFDQEPVTQLQLGVQQAFPAREARESRARGARALAGGYRAQEAARMLTTILATRRVWLDAYYWRRAEDVVQRNQGLFRQLVSITQGVYGAGRGDQQDVLRARLELDRLRNQLMQIRRQQASARAELAKWVGEDNASRPLPVDFPELPAPPGVESVLAELESHAVLDVASAQIEAQQSQVAEAEAAYLPTWMLDISYGLRRGRDGTGSERPDFTSVMLSVDLPLFTDKRQDQRLAAARESADAALLTREEQARELRQQFEDARAQLHWLRERLELYDRELLPSAQDNAQAALNSYQSGTTDFTALMRAYITLLETELQAEEVRVEHASAEAELLYLAGDPE